MTTQQTGSPQPADISISITSVTEAARGEITFLRITIIATGNGYNAISNHNGVSKTCKSLSVQGAVVGVMAKLLEHLTDKQKPTADQIERLFYRRVSSGNYIGLRLAHRARLYQVDEILDRNAE